MFEGRKRKKEAKKQAEKQALADRWAMTEKKLWTTLSSIEGLEGLPVQKIDLLWQLRETVIHAVSPEIIAAIRKDPREVAVLINKDPQSEAFLNVLLKVEKLLETTIEENMKEISAAPDFIKLLEKPGLAKKFTKVASRYINAGEKDAPVAPRQPVKIQKPTAGDGPRRTA